MCIDHFCSCLDPKLTISFSALRYERITPSFSLMHCYRLQCWGCKGEGVDLFVQFCTLLVRSIHHQHPIGRGWAELLKTQLRSWESAYMLCCVWWMQNLSHTSVFINVLLKQLVRSERMWIPRKEYAAKWQKYAKSKLNQLWHDM